jgi:hypothetical protein
MFFLGIKFTKLHKENLYDFCNFLSAFKNQLFIQNRLFIILKVGYINL